MKTTLIFPHVAHETLGDLGYVPKLFAKKTVRGQYSKLLTIPLALPTLAALTPPGVEVRLIDESLDAIDFDEPVDVVGISFYTTLAPRAYEIADRFRARGVHVALGGAHPTLAPDEALQHADSVFVGEAEETWPQFIRDFQEKRAKRLYRAETPPDLQTRVIPRWDLVKTDYYSTFQVQTARGCPHDCDFCAAKAIAGRPRMKPVAHVIAEIQELRRYTNPHAPLTITFADDDLLANRAHAKELLQALVPLGIRWWCQCSITIARDDELLALARESGCDFLLIGIETISQKAQEEVNKGKLNKVAGFRDAIRKIHSHGISVFPGIIFGFDDDDPSVFRRTVQFVEESGVDFPMFNILTPYIGTRLTARLQAEQRLLPHTWDQQDSYHVLFTPKQMTAEQLRDGQRWAIMQTYSYESTVKRLEVACRDGSLDLQKSTFGDQFFRVYATVVLAREAATQDAPMRKFIAKLLQVMWSRRSVKTIALLMLLDRYEFVHRVLEKEARPAAPAT